MAETFVPNPRELPQVNHLDSDRTNAAHWNLEWCDQSRNIQHAYETGRRDVGANHHFSRLPRDASGHCKVAFPRKGGGWDVEEVRSA
ncbi:hypothetical protein [Roseomonas chloroacetimidivorans]|uniref:hypothetical protein n=1 Tax=Roseomonas chloroacetimidivorans TaxID=1766656 RepID=UPI003C7807A9